MDLCSPIGTKVQYGKQKIVRNKIDVLTAPEGTLLLKRDKKEGPSTGQFIFVLEYRP